MPKPVSRMIAKTAIRTSGFTGVRIVSTENTKRESLVFIKMDLALVSVRM